jgi:hypothetical protein
LAQIIHIGLTTVLILTIGLQVWLIYSAWFATPVIQQVEAEIGQALSCDEDYNRREIDGFFYPAHRAQGDILYLSQLCGLFWLSALALGVMISVLLHRSGRRIPRLNELLIGLVLVLLVPIALYGSIIYRVAGAVE